MTVEGIPVLTLWQPWASLVALGAKTIETRSWSTQYRGPLAIHAAAKVPTSVRDYDPGNRPQVGEWKITRLGEWGAADQWFIERRLPDPGYVVSGKSERHPLPLGAIVATCTLVDVVPMWAPNLVERPYAGGLLVGTSSDRSRLLVWRTGGSHTAQDVTDQRPYGLFEPGRYAWLLADVVSVDPPVPFKGGQGLTRRWVPLAA